MSRHIRLHGRPLHVDIDPTPPLSLAGDFDPYTVGVDYEGRIDIVNSLGRCTVELIAGELPEGYNVFVDNFTKQVVIRWPGFTIEEPVTEIPNGDFQAGRIGWELPPGWDVELYEKEITPPTFPGNYALYCRATGRGDHVAQSVRYPCPPGTSVTAQALFDQGPSNKDNVNLWTALAFYNAAGQEIHEERGNRIHDETNKRRHWSTVTHISPGGTEEVALRVIVHRRNRRNREVIVDDCSWNLTFAATIPSDDYPITLRVRDGSGRVAIWQGIIFAIDAVYFNSGPYPVVVVESIQSSGRAGSLSGGGYAVPPELVTSTGEVLSIALTPTTAFLEYDHPGDDEAVESTGEVLSIALTPTTTFAEYDHPGSADEAVTSTGEVLALNMEVTAAYPEYNNWPAEEIESSGIVIGITLNDV